MKRWKRWCVILLSMLMLLSALPCGAVGASAARKGVDVSRWQGTVDWAKAKQAGVEFAILRIGFRGYTVGAVLLGCSLLLHLGHPALPYRL